MDTDRIAVRRFAVEQARALPTTTSAAQLVAEAAVLERYLLHGEPATPVRPMSVRVSTVADLIVALDGPRALADSVGLGIAAVRIWRRKNRVPMRLRQKVRALAAAAGVEWVPATQGQPFVVIEGDPRSRVEMATP